MLFFMAEAGGHIGACRLACLAQQSDSHPWRRSLQTARGAGVSLLGSCSAIQSWALCSCTSQFTGLLALLHACMGSERALLRPPQQAPEFTNRKSLRHPSFRPTLDTLGTPWSARASGCNISLRTSRAQVRPACPYPGYCTWAGCRSSAWAAIHTSVAACCCCCRRRPGGQPHRGPGWPAGRAGRAAAVRGNYSALLLKAAQGLSLLGRPIAGARSQRCSLCHRRRPPAAQPAPAPGPAPASAPARARAAAGCWSMTTTRCGPASRS